MLRSAAAPRGAGPGRDVRMKNQQLENTNIPRGSRGRFAADFEAGPGFLALGARLFKA